MSKAYDLKIITPDRVVFEGKVQSLTCPGTEGRFQVLYNHAPFLSSLEVGSMDVTLEDGVHVMYAIGGGTAQVFHNAVLVLADTAERSDEIDMARATAARSRAEQRLAAREHGIDIDRARIALMRAVNRLKLGSAS
ncbi:MAG: F0F1 ATP synthase subunit epsilon [Ignavibacteria bacterium]|nr:F0F1 ATP synthase subunit epsilon [Ignavibacteria bacterium]